MNRVGSVAYSVAAISTASVGQSGDSPSCSRETTATCGTCCGR
jgi:hypothetical protein